MSGNEIGISIFVIILGLSSLLMAFKYNKDFHNNYVYTRLGSGEQGGAMLFINVLKFFPYWVYRTILFILGMSLLVGIGMLIFNFVK
ncbi:hypothetical protein [Bacillus cereus group sp. BY128LC]|uniref:hypothetical protein n=1 Tax=Bacillus cereus group sp. BY128LC TaxID=3018084 RepID=UPI0022E4A4D5|nr:hypothetical protein [Bacillus cereus group sp. BY128LC]MDA1866749.1 hypothetical protein [Bacillus cereus group sp. BY128LC]